MNIQPIEGGVCVAKGFTAAGIHCGIRKNKDKKDLALIVSATPASAASVYTQNKVKGAPILVTKKNIQNGIARAVICNSGNANTCNADGIEKANAMCKALAAALSIDASDVIVASTGVIGQPLPLEPIVTGIPALVAALSQDGENAAQAILTTDTQKKQVAVEFVLSGKLCHLGGIAKGSGMIHPNMATMLCFLTCDAAISPAMLQKALSSVVDDTFNMVSVDGDTSTNDMVSILANGAANNPTVACENEDYATFVEALTLVCKRLCKMVAKDGEGATKLLESLVSGAPNQATARAVAKSVITSSLFKAAMFGEDANWGRILCAIGYAEGEFAIDQVSVRLKSQFGEVLVCTNGAGVDFSEEEAAKILGSDEIKILIDLGAGHETARAYGCDLTYDYVKINGDYRS